MHMSAIDGTSVVFVVIIDDRTTHNSFVLPNRKKDSL